MAQESIYSLYFSPGNRFGNWTILKEIESSETRKVFLVCQDRMEQGGCAVLKIFTKGHISLPLFENFLKKEYEILSCLSDHINIARLLPQEKYSTCFEETELYYLLMEYCPGGNLEEFFLENPQERQEKAADIFLCLDQIAQGLEYAHSREIIHGNLLEKNMLLMRPSALKISDFGLSAMTKGRLWAKERPIQYSAPELFQNGTLTAKSDIWSLGITLYRLLFGAFPFQAEQEKEYLSQCEKGTIEWPSSVSSQSLEGILIYFLRQMLSFEPKKRPTAKELSQSIKRCQHLVSPIARGDFAKRFLLQVEKKDQRLQTKLSEKLVLPTMNIEIPKGENAVKKSTKSKIFKIAAICLTFMLLSSTFYFFPIKEFFPGLMQILEKIGESQKSIEKASLNIFPEIAEICLRFQVVLESKAGEKFSWKNIEENKGKIELYYQHEKSPAKTIEASEEKLLEGNFSWEIPLEIENGMISFWASIKQEEFPPVISSEITILLKSQEDRQSYAKAIQEEELYAHDLAEYEKITQAFAKYLQDFPHGLFSKQAQETLSLYHDKAATYSYQELMDSIRKSPEDLKEILGNCLVFSRKYPNFSRIGKIQSIAEYCENMLKENTYEITLTKASIPNKFLNADCYVKVYAKQKLVWQSSVKKDNNDPQWNEKFTLKWKAGDEIQVELWDKNIEMIKDKLYFSITAKNMLAIYCFEKRMEKAKHWMEFTCSLPERPY